MNLPNGIVEAYGYDGDSRVTGMNWTRGGNPIGNLVYSYDPDGRVIGKTGSFAQTNLPQSVSGNTFNSANEMTAFNGTPLSYDGNGNLTSDGMNAYAWDARNHLMGISGATAASFVYDGVGRRIGKSIGGTATQFLYDGFNPVQELQSGSPSANILTGLGIDEYFQSTDSEARSSYLSDALRSTLALADSAGAVATSYSYDPFGNTMAAGSSSNSYQFTGRENDNTGLYYYRARYYSPTLQRFISQDPIDFRGGDTDLYRYVSDQPTVATDPRGLCRGRPCVGTALIIAGSPDTIGTKGGFSGDTVGPIQVAAGSAAVDPSQWFGGTAEVRSMLGQISGQTAAGPSFNGVSATIGGDPPDSWTDSDEAADYFAYNYPDDLLIELPSLPKQTPFETPILVNVPFGYPCPDGTTEF